MGDVSNPQRLNSYAYALNDPYKYIDPKGLDTYLILYGSGYVSYAMSGQEHDVGKLFEYAAKSKKSEIENSKSFNKEKDKVITEYTPTVESFQKAVEKKYDSGEIKEVDVFSHAWTSGMNLGGTENQTEGLARWVDAGVLSQIKPDFSKNGRAIVWGCNAAKDADGIAYEMSKTWGIPVTGSTGPMEFRSGNGRTIMVPSSGGVMKTFSP